MKFFRGLRVANITVLRSKRPPKVERLLECWQYPLGLTSGARGAERLHGPAEHVAAPHREFDALNVTSSDVIT